VTFGKWLQHERETLGFTQAELARQLACATITLRKIEADERRPAREIVNHLADILDLKLEQRAAFFKFARNGTFPTFFSEEPNARQFRARVSNLPFPASPFFGRDIELEVIGDLLQNKSVRILTLTGTGGIGKTRLATEAGDALRDQFRDGIFFIHLAPFTNAALVPAAIAHVLKLRARESDSILAIIKEHLRGKQLLLILDNFEQVLAAAPIAQELADASRRVKILITSRQPLHLAREHIFEVPPLDAPDPKRLPALANFSNYPAASLFLTHARAARADFLLTQDNARFVARICAHLEGIPLALELAAARIKYFPIQEIASRLEQRFRLLRADAEHLPPRHLTLTATLNWSYELLSDAERALLRRLAVFAGGCTVSAAEQVCAGETLVEADVLHTLTQLADKSLLKSHQDTERARFRMLETIREYAWERLAHAQEDARFRDAQLAYFSFWANAITHNAETDAQRSHQFDLERDNVRAAFEWALRTNQIEIGLRMAGAVWQAWSNTLHVNQYIPFFKFDAALLTPLYETARALEKDAAPQSKTEIAYALRCLGVLALLDAEYPTTRKFFELSLKYYQDLQDAIGANNLRNDLGELARLEGDYARAVELFKENMPLARQVGGEELGVALHNLGQVEMQRANFARAQELFVEGMNINRAANRDWRVLEFLAALAELASAQNKMERAATLTGAVEALLEQQALNLTPADRKTFDHYAAKTRALLGDVEFSSMLERGRAMSLQAAAEYALDEIVGAKHLKPRM